MNINFDECEKLMNDLKVRFYEAATIKNDPASFITDQFLELNRLVDLRRETLLVEVHARSDGLLKEIEKEFNTCLASLNDRESKADSFIAFKSQLDELHKEFESYQIDFKNSADLLMKAKELEKGLEQMVEELAVELMGDQIFRLTTHKYKIDEVFGSLDIKQVRFINYFYKEKFNFIKYFNFNISSKIGFNFSKILTTSQSAE